MVNEGLEVEESGGRRRPIKLMFRRVRYPLQTRRLRIYIPLKTMSFYNIGSWYAIRGIASKKITIAVIILCRLEFTPQGFYVDNCIIK